MHMMNAVFIEAEFINIACGVHDDFVAGSICGLCCSKNCPREDCHEKQNV